jgi:hypothetical protein
MALPERSSGGRHPSPVPSRIPDSDADTSVPRRVTIHFYDDKGAHKKEMIIFARNFKTIKRCYQQED